MAEQCKACGAEIVAGQRFCRHCGAAVAQSSSEELPTKVFEPGPPMDASIMTSPLSTQVTEQVYQQPTAYQPPTANRATLPTPSASTGKSSVLRLLPLVLIGLVGAALLGAFLYARISHRAVVAPAADGSSTPSVKVVVNHPAQPAASVMSEDGATITDDKTVITRTYPLGDDASISVTNITGKIKIEGWDKAQAEVKVIKDGGSQQDRQAVQVRLASRNDLLSLETSPTRSSPVEVHYELKLPRHVRQLEIKSADSEVKLSKLAGAITVALQGSSIELKDVSGSINTKIVQGETKAVINGNLTGPQVLKSVNGDIELRLETEVNADISAETVDGEIEADDEFNLRVENRRVGQSASGRVGSGGVSVSIKTVNGDIRIKK
jgi:Putative adhesin/zinc-ribbon domain